MIRLRSARPRRAVLLLVGVLIGLQALTGAAAAAPNPLDCSPVPTPERPGAGFVGFLDTPSLGKGVPGTPYDEVSYAGLTWNTYGYSGPCAAALPQVNGSNWMANGTFSAAKVFVGAVNGLNWMIVDSTGIGVFDDFVVEMVGVLYENLFVVLVGLALLIASVSMMFMALRGDLASIGTKTLYALGGLWLASTTFFAPMLWVGVTDNVLVRGTAELETSLLRSQSSGPPDLPTLLHDQVVVQPWLTGEFGAADAPEAERYGRDLMRAQACTKQEVVANRCDNEAKKAEFKRIAGEVENTPAASWFSGESGRMGPAMIALAKALAMSAFQLFAKMGLLFLQLLARGLVIAGPVLGLLAIMNNSVLPKVGRALLLALFNGLLLTLTGAGQTYLIAWICDPVRDIAPTLQVILIALITGILLVAIRPWRRLQEMAAATAGIQLPSPADAAMRRQMRRMNRRSRGFSRRLGRLGNGGVDSEWWMSPGEDAQPPPVPQQPSTELERSSWFPQGFRGFGRPEGATIHVNSERVHAHGEYPRAGQVKRGPIALGAGGDSPGGSTRRAGPGPESDPGGDSTGRGGPGSGSGPSLPQRELPASGRTPRSESAAPTVYRPEESETPRRNEGTNQPERPARPSTGGGHLDARRIYRPAEDTDAGTDPADRPRPEGER